MPSGNFIGYPICEQKMRALWYITFHFLKGQDLLLTTGTNLFEHFFFSGLTCSTVSTITRFEKQCDLLCLLWTVHRHSGFCMWRMSVLAEVTEPSSAFIKNKCHVSQNLSSFKNLFSFIMIVIYINVYVCTNP